MFYPNQVIRTRKNKKSSRNWL